MHPCIYVHTNTHTHTHTHVYIIKGPGGPTALLHEGIPQPLRRKRHSCGSPGCRRRGIQTTKSVLEVHSDFFHSKKHHSTYTMARTLVLTFEFCFLASTGLRWACRVALKTTPFRFSRNSQSWRAWQSCRARAMNRYCSKDSGKDTQTLQVQK